MKAMICGREMFYSGNLELIDMPSIAIVGSRNCTDLGKKIAYSIAKWFAANGFIIVSGLAKGIDTAAHQGALDAGGLTIAVLGTDLDHIYPRENTPLANRIVENGGLICTEYDRPEYDHNLAKKRFTDRDEIIVDLSEAIFPVQAELRKNGSSGTLTTARYAFSQDKLIFVPAPPEGYMDKYPEQYAGLIALDHECYGYANYCRIDGKEDYQDIVIPSIEQRRPID